MKRLLVLVAVLIMVGSLVACNGGKSVEAADFDRENPSGKLVIWGWWTDIDDTWQKFADKYENVELEYIYMKGDDYFTKLQQAAASGLELPDVIFLDMKYRGKIFDLGILEKLDAAPYNYDEDLVFEFTHAQNRNSKGDILSVPWDIATGGITINNILAEEYLGTTDKDELSEMFSSWDKIIEVGKQVKEASNEKIWTFTCYDDVVSMMFMPNIEKLVQKDGSVGITPFFTEIFTVIKKMVDADIVNLNRFPDAGFLGSFAGNETLMWAGPIWMKDVIASMDKEAPEGKYTLIKAPDVYVNGGTSAGVSTRSENPELAYMFIEWFLLSQEGAELNTYLISAKAPYENNPDLASRIMSIYGDQDIGKMYVGELAKDAPVMPLTIYENDIKQIIADLTVQLTENENMTVEEIIEKAIAEFKNRYPDVKVK